MLSYIGRWIRYLISAFATRAAIGLSTVGVCRPFFQGVIAANAVGKAAHAYKHGKYFDVYNAIKGVAEYDVDDPYVGSSQYILGLLYFHGYAVNQDRELAHKYFEKAAQRGNTDALSYLKRTEHPEPPPV